VIDIPTSNASSHKGRSATFTRALDRADCKFTPYQLRHQYVYQMCMAGVPVETQCDMLGHSYAVHKKHYRLFMRSLERVREIRQANASRSGSDDIF
jgi:site-specific recombinase XerD